MKRTSSRVRHSRQLLAAVLTIAMLVTFMPGMAFASDEAAAKTKGGVSTADSAANYQRDIDGLKAIYDGLSANVKASDNGKAASALITNLNASVLTLKTAEQNKDQIKATYDSYAEGDLIRTTSSRVDRSEPFPPGLWYANFIYTITYTASEGGAEWRNALGGTTNFISTTTGIIETTQAVAEAAAATAARTSAELKAHDSPQYRYEHATSPADKDTNAYSASYIASRENARNAYNINVTTLDPAGATINGIESGLVQLESRITTAQDDNLKASIADNERAINDAKGAIDNATSIIADANTKTLTDAQKDALDKLVDALDDVKDAQAALKDAIDDAKTASTSDELSAAQNAIDNARDAFADALTGLAQTESDFLLKGSIADSEKDLKDAQDALDNATSAADDAKTKDLTDAQKKALEDLLAAIKRVKDAQKALQDALEKAKNAKTPEEILAAQREVDAARKELEDALASLVRIELIYDTTIKTGGGNSPITTPVPTPAGVNPPAKQETSGATTTKTTSIVAKIRTPIKTVYLTKNKSYKIPFVLDAKGGKPTKDSKLKVTSSKAKIVRLVNSGSSYKIKALKVGTTVVTIKAQNGKKVKIKVIVQKKKVTLKKFTVKAPKTLKKGKTYQLKITKLTKKASNITAVTFKSSSKKIAKVDKAGKITALKKGTVEISIKVGKKKLVKTIIIK